MLQYPGLGRIWVTSKLPAAQVSVFLPGSRTSLCLFSRFHFLWFLKCSPPSPVHILALSFPGVTSAIAVPTGWVSSLNCLWGQSPVITSPASVSAGINHPFKWNYWKQYPLFSFILFPQPESFLLFCFNMHYPELVTLGKTQCTIVVW